jgi:hypothetical protein
LWVVIDDEADVHFMLKDRQYILMLYLGDVEMMFFVFVYVFDNVCIIIIEK